MDIFCIFFLLSSRRQFAQHLHCSLFFLSHLQLYQLIVSGIEIEMARKMWENFKLCNSCCFEHSISDDKSRQSVILKRFLLWNVLMNLKTLQKYSKWSAATHPKLHDSWSIRKLSRQSLVLNEEKEIFVRQWNWNWNWMRWTLTFFYASCSDRFFLSFYLSRFCSEVVVILFLLQIAQIDYNLS